MTKKGVAAYRKANPGSKLKTAVTGKVKKGSKAAARRKSFCARMGGFMVTAEVATTSGNSVAVTGLPVGIRNIAVFLQDVSSTGSNEFALQVSTGTTFATSGYKAASWNGANVDARATGLMLTYGVAAVQTAGWDRGTWSSGPWGQGLASNGAVGAVAISGAAPSLVTGDFAQPTVGALTLAGVAPTITNKLDIVPLVGAVSLAGLVPELRPANITTLVGSIGLASTAPLVVNFASRTLTGSVTIGGVAPILGNPNWIIIDTSQTADWKEI